MGALDLTVRQSALAGQTHEWLASSFGVDKGRTVTLDLALFNWATFTDKRIPSGVIIAKVTATGRYGPYNDAATDGRQTAVGILLMDADAKHIAGTPSGDVLAPMLWRGDVIEAKLPTGHGLDAAGKTDLINRIAFS